MQRFQPAWLLKIVSNLVEPLALKRNVALGIYTLLLVLEI